MPWTPCTMPKCLRFGVRYITIRTQYHYYAVLLLNTGIVGIVYSRVLVY